MEFKRPKGNRMNRSPTSFRQLSQSIEKRLKISSKASNLKKLSFLKTPPPLQFQKQSSFTNLVLSRSPSSSSKHLDQSSSIFKPSKTTIKGLQFQGIKQKLNLKKQLTLIKSPSKYISGGVIGKKIKRKALILEKENNNPLNVLHREENDQSVIHSREDLVFDMSPTL